MGGCDAQEHGRPREAKPQEARRQGPLTKEGTRNNPDAPDKHPNAMRQALTQDKSFLPLSFREREMSTNFFCANSFKSIRIFEKGLAGRGGWREEILPMPEIQTSFLCPFSYATPLGEGEHNSGIYFAVFRALLVDKP